MTMPEKAQLYLSSMVYQEVDPYISGKKGQKGRVRSFSFIQYLTLNPFNLTFQPLFPRFGAKNEGKASGGEAETQPFLLFLRS